jgi:hypothetical protein
MTIHYIHRDGNDFKIRANEANDTFYVHTDGGEGGTPGVVQSFSYVGDTSTSCNSSTPISYNWTPPAYDGGSPITGYALRRIATVNNNTIDGPVQGFPDAVLDNFGDACAGGDFGSQPTILGNITSIQIDGWACGYYSFQIAAINANGIGLYYPTEESDLLTFTRGWTDVGSNVVTATVDSTINVNYVSSPDGCGPTQINYQNTSGNLYDWNNSTLQSTYTGFSQGTAQFTKPATAGWYYVRIWETWTDYTTQCQTEKVGCLITPFYVS